MTRILRDKQTHPLIAQMMRPTESSDPLSATAAASSASSSRGQWQFAFRHIFVDYSWSAGLYLCEDCHCLVFTQMRSHSSRALCARVSVCGGALRAAVVPDALRKGYRVAWGMREKKHTTILSVLQLLSKHRHRKASCATFCPERMD